MVGGAMVGGTMTSRAVVSRAVGSQQSRRNPSPNPSPSPSPNPNLNPNPEHTSAAIHMQLARIAASTQLLNHLRWRCGQGVSGGGRGSGDGAGTAGEGGGGGGGGLAAAAAAGTAWLGTEYGCAHGTASHIAWLGSWAHTWREQCPQRRSGAAPAHSRPHTSPGCHRPTVASLGPQAPRPSPPRGRTRPGTWGCNQPGRDVPTSSVCRWCGVPTLLDHVRTWNVVMDSVTLPVTVSASLASFFGMLARQARVSAATIQMGAAGAGADFCMVPRTGALRGPSQRWMDIYR